MSGQAFMMTDEGIVPITQLGEPMVLRSAPSDPEQWVPGGAALARGQVAFDSDRLVAPATASAPQSAQPIATPRTEVVYAPLRPADVIRSARSRVKEIRTEIRRLRALEKELAELERLIAAAKQKPVAIVRNIDQARHTR